MRATIAVMLVLILSACGAATVDDTTGAASGVASAASGVASAASSGGITVGEPWVRAALLMDDAAASGMPMEASAASGMPMEASAAPEMSMAASAMGDGMDMGESMDMGGAVSAGYMTLSNAGAEQDRLVGASSDVAGEVQLHTSEMKDNVMSMRQVQSIDVPANGSVALKPGGYHLMFLDLKRTLAAGETVKLTLRFERSGTIEVDAPVREAGAE